MRAKASRAYMATTIREAVSEALKSGAETNDDVRGFIAKFYSGRQWRPSSINSALAVGAKPQVFKRYACGHYSTLLAAKRAA